MNARSWLTSSSVPGQVGEPLLEQLQRLDVEIVGRLVHHEHVERPGKEPRQQESIALAARERFHRRQRSLGRKQKIPQVAVDVLRPAVDRHRVVTVGDRFPDRAIGIELLALLIVVGDLHVRAAPHLSGIGLELAEEQLEQRGLAGAVRSNEADAVAAHHPQRRSWRRPGVRRMTSRSARPRRPSGRCARRSRSAGEPTRSGDRRAARSSRMASSARTRPSFRVRRGLDALAQPRFLLRQPLVELRVDAPLRRRAIPPCAGGTSRSRRATTSAPAIQLDDPSRQRLEKHAVVRHEQHGARNSRPETLRATASSRCRDDWSARRAGADPAPPPARAPAARVARQPPESVPMVTSAGIWSLESTISTCLIGVPRVSAAICRALRRRRRTPAGRRQTGRPAPAGRCAARARARRRLPAAPRRR